VIRNPQRPAPASRTTSKPAAACSGLSTTTSAILNVTGNNAVTNANPTFVTVDATNRVAQQTTAVTPYNVYYSFSRQLFVADSNGVYNYVATLNPGNP